MLVLEAGIIAENRLLRMLAVNKVMLHCMEALRYQQSHRRAKR